MTDFEIKQLEQDARRLIICTGCYGSGEDRWNEGRACPACSGSGKSAAQPGVITLIERLRLVESQLLDANYTLNLLSQAEKERDEAIRLGDERLATLWDEKNAEIAKIAAERDEAKSDAARLRDIIKVLKGMDTGNGVLWVES